MLFSQKIVKLKVFVLLGIVGNDFWVATLLCLLPVSEAGLPVMCDANLAKFFTDLFCMFLCVLTETCRIRPHC